MYDYHVTLCLDCCPPEYLYTWNFLETYAEEGWMDGPGAFGAGDGGLFRLVRGSRSLTITLGSTNLKSCILMKCRKQRQRAIKIMQTVNQRYGLPNPPTWYERISKSHRRIMMRLRSILLLPGQVPARVSGAA